MVRRHDLDLENKCFYRLIKVAYVFFLAIGFIGVFCVGWSDKPYQVVDTKESYLVCEHGLHSIKDTGLNVLNTNTLDSDNDHKARLICLRDEKNKQMAHPNNNQNSSNEITPALARAELKRRAMIHQTNQQVYELSLSHETFGSWRVALKWWFFGSMIVFLIFNLMKQSLLYIVYGKKFGVPVISGSEKCWR